MGTTFISSLYPVASVHLRNYPLVKTYSLVDRNKIHVSGIVRVLYCPVNVELRDFIQVLVIQVINKQFNFN